MQYLQGVVVDAVVRPLYSAQLMWAASHTRTH